jgi:LmbE family N-acetylglucosaminyl deacetylase
MEEVTGLEAFDEVERLMVVAAHPDDLETVLQQWDVFPL